MALARVQTTPSGTTAGGTSVAVTFTTPPTVGNGLVVAVLGDSNFTAAPTAVTDNRGNTYALAAKATSSVFSQTAALYYCAKIAATGAPFTITVTTGVSACASVAAATEVSGVGGGLAIDQIKQTSGSTSAVAPGATPALTGTEVFVAAAFVINNNGTNTVESVSPTWTQEFDTGAGNPVGEFDTRVVTSALGTTQSCSWTSTGGGVWGAVVVAFKGTVTAVTETRVTQDAIETLSLPILPAARVTQGLVEILASSVSSAAVGRVTQALIEILQQSPPPTPTRLTQALVEILQTSPPPVGVRVTQVAVDVFYPRVVVARQTQAAVEVFYPRTIPARLTQAVVEYYRHLGAGARASQLVVEVFLTLPPCTTGAFPIDDLPAGGSCPIGDLP